MTNIKQDNREIKIDRRTRNYKKGFVDGKYKGINEEINKISTILNSGNFKFYFDTNTNGRYFRSTPDNEGNKLYAINDKYFISLGDANRPGKMCELTKTLEKEFNEEIKKGFIKDISL